MSKTNKIDEMPEYYVEVNHTKVVLTQDKNISEKAQQESQKNWGNMLGPLKEVVEGH